MAGKLGYDIRVNEFTPQELQFSQEAVKTYKRISDIIWQGDLYRIISPYEENRAVTMYVNENKSKAILFNYIFERAPERYFYTSAVTGARSTKEIPVRKRSTCFRAPKPITPIMIKCSPANT